MQHNFHIPNQQGAEYRADVNSALQALATLSSGPVAPTAPYPHMWWMDTSSTPPVLRRRSADNTFWQVVDPGTVNSYFKRNADGDVIAQTAAELAAELAPLIGNFEPGTRMVFHQETAPLGWTQDTSVNDRMLRIVSGNTGGNNGGSWTISGLSASVSIGATTLSVAQMPSHSHPVSFRYDNGGGTDNIGGTRTDPSVTSTNTGATGGGGSHTHSASASISSNGSWRPSYTDVIVCEKD